MCISPMHLAHYWLADILSVQQLSYLGIYCYLDLMQAADTSQLCTCSALVPHLEPTLL